MLYFLLFWRCTNQKTTSKNLFEPREWLFIGLFRGVVSTMCVGLAETICKVGPGFIEGRKTDQLFLCHSLI